WEGFIHAGLRCWSQSLPPHRKNLILNPFAPRCNSNPNPPGMENSQQGALMDTHRENESGCGTGSDSEIPTGDHFSDLRASCTGTVQFPSSPTDMCPTTNDGSFTRVLHLLKQPQVFSCPLQLLSQLLESSCHNADEVRCASHGHHHVSAFLACASWLAHPPPSHAHSRFDIHKHFNAYLQQQQQQQQQMHQMQKQRQHGTAGSEPQWLSRSIYHTLAHVARAFLKDVDSWMPLAKEYVQCKNDLQQWNYQVMEAALATLQVD
ncbi:unnamed protein product, partial [Closterium sp. NIES-53]